MYNAKRDLLPLSSSRHVQFARENFLPVQNSGLYVHLRNN
jgi:hypothetical protein